MKFPVHLQNTPSEILNHGLVQYLLATIEDQSLKINHLEAEVRLLKGHSATPVIPPNSNLEGIKSYSCKEVKKTPFSKRSKKSSLIIHATKRISATNVPKGSVFKGYKKSIRQDLHISAVNTCYELESWQTPDGTYHYASLPDHLQGTDFGPNLKSYILYQYHQPCNSAPVVRTTIGMGYIDFLRSIESYADQRAPDVSSGKGSLAYPRQTAQQLPANR